MEGAVVMGNPIIIAKEFSPFPGGRRRADGPYSGEAFRDDVLKPALRNGGFVVLDLDGVAGLPSSFWEEVFGGAIRKKLISLDDMTTRLRVKTSEPELEVYRNLAYRYAKEAAEAVTTTA